MQNILSKYWYLSIYTFISNNVYIFKVSCVTSWFEIKSGRRGVMRESVRDDIGTDNFLVQSDSSTWKTWVELGGHQWPYKYMRRSPSIINTTLIFCVLRTTACDQIWIQVYQCCVLFWDFYIVVMDMLAVYSDTSDDEPTVVSSTESSECHGEF